MLITKLLPQQLCSRLLTADAMLLLLHCWALLVHVHVHVHVHVYVFEYVHVHVHNSTLLLAQTSQRVLSK